MYALEYKQLFIVREQLTKNRTMQSYRWKQYAICEDKNALYSIMYAQKNPKDWRVVPMAYNSVKEVNE